MTDDIFDLDTAEASIEQAKTHLPYNVESVSEISDGRQIFTIVCDDGYENDVIRMISKMNKKLKKWNSDIQLLEINERHEEVQSWFSRRKVVRRKALLTISAPAVAGTGAKLIGSFERAEAEGEVYCHALNDTPEEVVHAYKHRWDECDHCKTKRNRNQSFLCETDEGEIVLIGRQCSQAYLGLHPAEILAREGIRKLLGAQPGFTPDGEWVGFCTRYRDMEELVQLCYLIAKRFGGYSREKRPEMLEHLAALDGFRFKGSPEIVQWYRDHPVKEPLDYYALADFVENMRGDYGENLRIALLSDVVRPKRINLIMSGVGLFVGRAAKEPKKEIASARHLLPGQPKDRVDFIGTVTRTVPYQSYYGNGLVIAIEGEDGSQCVHFSTKEVNPEAGKKYAIRATIKEQDHAKVQTVIIRAEYTPIAA